MAQRSSDRVDGITVQLSHVDKEFFPGDGISKGDLIEYYRRLAPAITRYLRDRPLVMGRYPDGITGHRIVQKNVPDYFPGWISRAEVAKQDGTVCHVVCDKPATLVYLANQGCIEPHVFLSRLGALDQPDQLVFDLDPPDAEHFGLARRYALELRKLLEGELGLAAFVKTTGGKGLHVHVPLRPERDFDTVRGFARDVASALAGRFPRQVTMEQRKESRGQRLYLDIMRNAYAQTVIVPYAVRARSAAPVATPLYWAEVEDEELNPRQFTMPSITGRLARAGDPWADMAQHRHRLSGSRLSAAAGDLL